MSDSAGDISELRVFEAIKTFPSFLMPIDTQSDHLKV